MKRKNLVVLIIMEIVIISFSLLMIFVPFKSRDLTFEAFYNDDEKALINMVIDAVEVGQFEILENEFNKTADLSEGILALNEYFQKHKVTDIRIIDCNPTKFASKQTKRKNTIFQYSVDFQDSLYGLLLVELVTENEELAINTLRITPLERPVEELNSFYKEKMGIKRIGILLFSLLLILCLVYSEYDYYKNINRPRIWLQILMPVSITVFAIDWNTLAVKFNPLVVSLTPLSMFSSGNAGVWQYKIAFPVFLAVYWILFRKRHNQIEDKQLKENLNTTSNSC